MKIKPLAVWTITLLALAFSVVGLWALLALAVAFSAQIPWQVWVVLSLALTLSWAGLILALANPKQRLAAFVSGTCATIYSIILFFTLLNWASARPGA